MKLTKVESKFVAMSPDKIVNECQTLMLGKMKISNTVSSVSYSLIRRPGCLFLWHHWFNGIDFTSMIQCKAYFKANTCTVCTVHSHLKRNCVSITFEKARSNNTECSKRLILQSNLAGTHYCTDVTTVDAQYIQTQAPETTF